MSTALGDISVITENAPGATSVFGDLVPDYQRVLANFPFTYMGSGLDYAFPVSPISGSSGYWLRYLGHNNSQEIQEEADFNFSASARKSKQVNGSWRTFKLDFSVYEAEVNRLQTIHTAEDIARRTREAQQKDLMNVVFEELTKAQYTAATTPQEDRFLGTVGATVSWDPQTQKPITATSNQPWNMQKVLRAKWAMSANKIDNSVPYVVLAAEDSLAGMDDDPRAQNSDYRDFRNAIAMTGKGDFFRQPSMTGYGGFHWISFPNFEGTDSGGYQGVPRTGTDPNFLYSEFFVHPRCVHYVKPAEAPSMYMEAYFDKNSAQMRFRSRHRVGFVVMNPTGIVRVRNQAGYVTLS